jgi:hypothetical protein
MDKSHLQLPDWLGSGEDLFGTIHIIQSKKIDKGYLEIDYNFKFTDKFRYPVVFTIKSIESLIVADGIGFRVHLQKDKSKKSIDEKITIPSMCKILKLDDFIDFFAQVVKNDVAFALYLEQPEKFKDLKVYELKSSQIIVFNDKLSMKIMNVLDKEKAGQSLPLDTSAAF